GRLPGGTARSWLDDHPGGAVPAQDQRYLAAAEGVGMPDGPRIGGGHGADPDRMLPPPGFGVNTCRQDVPSQCTLTVRRRPLLVLKPPTAHTSVAEAALTASRLSPLVLGPGVGAYT